MKSRRIADPTDTGKWNKKTGRTEPIVTPTQVGAQALNPFLGGNQPVPGTEKEAAAEFMRLIPGLAVMNFGTTSSTEPGSSKLDVADFFRNAADDTIAERLTPPRSSGSSRDIRRQNDRRYRGHINGILAEARDDCIFHMAGSAGMTKERFLNEVSYPRTAIAHHLNLYRNSRFPDPQMITLFADYSRLGRRYESIDNAARIDAYMKTDHADDSPKSPEAVCETILSPEYLFEASLQCGLYDLTAEEDEDELPTLTGALLSEELKFALKGLDEEEQQKASARSLVTLNYANIFKGVVVLMHTMDLYQDEEYTDGNVRALLYGDISITQSKKNKGVQSAGSIGAIGAARQAHTNLGYVIPTESRQILAEFQEMQDVYGGDMKKLPDWEGVAVDMNDAFNARAFEHNRRLVGLVLTHTTFTEPTKANPAERQPIITMSEMTGIVEALEYISKAQDPMKSNTDALEAMYHARIQKIKDQAVADHQKRMAQIAAAKAAREAEIERLRQEAADWQAALDEEADENFDVEMVSIIQAASAESEQRAANQADDDELACLMLEDADAYEQQLIKENVTFATESIQDERLQRKLEHKEEIARKQREAAEALCRAEEEDRKAEAREKQQKAEAEAAQKRKEEEYGALGEDWLTLDGMKAMQDDLAELEASGAAFWAVRK